MDQSRSHELNNVAHSSLLLTNSIAPPLSTQAEHGMPSTVALPSSCCCGQLQCAYLQHNSAALEELEKDLRSAAQIGQVCSQCPFRGSPGD